MNDQLSTAKQAVAPKGWRERLDEMREADYTYSQHPELARVVFDSVIDALDELESAAPAQQEQAPQPMTDEQILELVPEYFPGTRDGNYFNIDGVMCLHTTRFVDLVRALLSRHPALPVDSKEAVSAPVAIDDLKEQNAELVKALKYARRFLKPVDHDTAYVDQVIASAHQENNPAAKGDV